MIITSHHQPEASPELLNYLKVKLGLSDNALKLGVRQSKLEQAPLPIILWSFGLINIIQYQDVVSWEKDNLL